MKSTNEWIPAVSGLQQSGYQLAQCAQITATITEEGPDQLRQRKRDLVIARTFLGEVQFEQKTLDEWLAGAVALQEISDSVTCFVHLVDQQMTDELKDTHGSDIPTRFADELNASLGISTLPWENFDLEPDDFLDINHMNARGGREKLSCQLAKMLIS